MRRRGVLLTPRFFFHYPYTMASFFSTTTATAPAPRRNRKIVVIMGATGCGKSKLSLDMVTRFFPPSEIINSDKMQVYRGLDITTNKIPLSDRQNVPHSLIGEFDSSESHPEFTPSDFRVAASRAISRIFSQRKIPFVVGGSNSFIYALLAKEFDAYSDVFGEIDSTAVVCRELRYRCCFIWIDASPAVLNRYLVKRVDDMLESGMYDELSRYFSSAKSGSSASQCGLRKAIGVPEFEKYFEKFPEGVEARRTTYGEAVRAIKDNTCQLGKRQLGKIQRLKDGAGWDLKRVDATDFIRAATEGTGGGGGGRRAAEIWEKQVLEPSVKIVKRFLME